LSGARRRELATLLERPVLFPALIEGDFAVRAGPGISATRFADGHRRSGSRT
jgi:hypothetical protein